MKRFSVVGSWAKPSNGSLLINLPSAGLWQVNSGVTFNTTASVGTAYFVARLNSGLLTWASGQIGKTYGGTTLDGLSIHLSAQIATTGLAATAVNVHCSFASSATRVLANTQDGIAGSTWASYYYVTKIG